MPGVVVIGDALLDVSVAPQEPIRPGGDVPASVRLNPGGQGANVAVRLARRGMRVRLVCGLGDDPAARLLLDALAADAVEVDPAPTPHTGVVALLLEGEGERAMFSQRAPFVTAHLDPASAGADEWLVVSGYVLLDEAADDVLQPWATGFARRAVLGCAIPEPRSAAWLAVVGSLAPDLIVLNHDEAARLLGRSGETVAVAADLAGTLGTLVVVTDAHGATAAGAGLGLTVAAPSPRAAPVDTTGAGDAFAAALIADLVQGWPPDAAALRAAMLRGLALAGEVVALYGAQARVASERGLSSP